MDRSKWDILQARLDAHNAEAAKLTLELRGLERTPFTANGTGRCSGCGDVLATEADFAKHFLVDDERYLNIGYCPKARLDAQLKKSAEAMERSEARNAAQ